MDDMTPPYTVTELDMEFSDHATANRKISSDIHPMWSPTPTMRNRRLSKSNSSLVLRCQEQQMWTSAPNLNFESDDDISCDLNASQPALSTRQTSVGPHIMKVNGKFGTSVKVRAGLLRNMSSNEKEVKDLFMQWVKNQKQSRASGALSQATRGNEPISNPLLQSPESKPDRPLRKKGKSSVLSSGRSLRQRRAMSSQTTSANSPTEEVSPRRKKKVAVKLKASDLNLSEDKKREIESMFWQWKSEIKDPTKPDFVVEALNNDSRWGEINTPAPVGACAPRFVGRWPSFTPDLAVGSECPARDGNMQVVPVRVGKGPVGGSRVKVPIEPHNGPATLAASVLCQPAFEQHGVEQMQRLPSRVKCHERPRKPVRTPSIDGIICKMERT